MRSALIGTALGALALGACARPPAAPRPAGHYEDGRAWLCVPGREDACASDLDATELTVGGVDDRSRVGPVVRETLAQTRDKVDCFYVYPTVDLSLRAGNHEGSSDLAPMTEATSAQAARFRSVCRLFVPLYRQVTLGTYRLEPEERAPYTAAATADVVDAFDTYLRLWNGGRMMVLFGHSQGAEMLVALLQRRFDHDPAMRARLLLAMPIGWPVEVPRGQVVGGTFENLPVCTKKGERACVVAYRSHAASGPVPSPRWVHVTPGRELACVDPAALLHGDDVPFSRSFFPTRHGGQVLLRDIPEIDTPFLLVRGAYRGRCTDGPGGYRYLAVSEALPGGPVRFDARLLRGDLGLHLLDYQFAQGDLLELVGERAAALP